MVDGRLRSEIIRLIIIFLAWKSFLLLIACTSPGLGYDTSTSLLGSSSDFLVDRLVRWDAIYYTKVAQRDYLFEQEWAFGWGYTRVVRALAALLPQDDLDFPLAEARSGILLAHVAHLVSVLALYDLTRLLFQRRLGFPNLAYTTSLLHILSPAGLFLSAPCAESLFSCLSFLAYDLHARSILNPDRGWRRDMGKLGAALLFGVSATVRSNGLLNGLLFVGDALHTCIELVRHSIDVGRIWRLVVISLCGCIVGLGYLMPQYIAWKEYCSVAPATPRPWCDATFPSIYNFVQQYYWNTGLFKYWTVPNLPLFVMGAPCIALFAVSVWWIWTITARPNQSRKAGKLHVDLTDRILQRIALPQAALAVLVVSSYHVQIINRLSAGYPLWYWWLAKALHEPDTLREWKTAKVAVIWMVTYAAVQGALFANFLPPA